MKVTGAALAAAAAGSAVGAALRYAAELAHARRHAGRPQESGRLDLPWATLTVNVVGSALLGVVAGLAAEHRLAAVPAVLLGAGLAGGLTTFSTFAVDAVQLAAHGRWRCAAAYVTVTLVGGFGAAAVGYWAASVGA